MSNILKIILSKRNKNNFSGGKLVTYLNPHSYLIARKNLDVYSKFDVLNSDGIALSILISLFLKKTERKSFDMTSMAGEVFRRTGQKGESIAFVGGMGDESKIASNKIILEFPELKFVFCRDGYFSDENERNVVIKEIVAINPDVVVVGMGAPLQEKFLTDLVKSGWNGKGYTCGGFFHQTAKTESIKYYPDWVDGFNLRWAYRIYDEPKLIKRYAFNYPIFLIVFLWDTLCFYIQKLRK